MFFEIDNLKCECGFIDFIKYLFYNILFGKTM